MGRPGLGKWPVTPRALGSCKPPLALASGPGLLRGASLPLPACQPASLPACLPARHSPPFLWSETVWEVDPDDPDPVACEKPITEVTSLTFKPSSQDDDSYQYTQKFASYVTKAAQFSRACEEAWVEMLVCIIGGTVAMGFMWVVFLWLFAGVIVFVAFAVLVITLLAITIICYVRAGWAPSLGDYLNSTDVTSGTASVGGMEFSYDDIATSDNQTAYGAMAIIMTILLALVIVMLVIWRKCIARCVAIIRESTKVFKVIPSMMVWPLVTIFWLSCTYVWAFFVAAYIFYADVGTYQDNLQTVTRAIESATNSSSSVDEYLDDPETSQWVMFFVHLFGVLWVVEFIKACAWITMSGAVCYWYFFKDDADKHERFPLLNSCRRVMRFHLGSAAFGALILAICQLIRYILATVDWYTKDLQDKNLLFKMAIKCSQCAMWCLQKTIEFISYFGFVYVALEGKNFCWSCKETFKFLLTPKNAAQTAVNKARTSTAPRHATPRHATPRHATPRTPHTPRHARHATHARHVRTPRTHARTHATHTG